MMARAVGHSTPSALQRRAPGPTARRPAGDPRSRSAPRTAPRGRHGLLVAAGVSEFAESGLGQAALRPHRRDRPLGGRVVAHGRGLGADLIHEAGENPFCLGVRMGRCQHAPLHHFGRLNEQAAEQPRRNIVAPSDRRDQSVVTLGAFEQRGKPRLGTSRARIGRHVMDDIAVAASDQHVGQRDIDLRAGRQSPEDALGSWSWRWRGDHPP